MLNNTNASCKATPKSGVEAAHRLRVDRARKVGMFTDRVKISPSYAAYVLEHHAPPGTNRNLSPSKVAQLAGQMAAGRWNPNSHQGIAFRADGVLADGQHRLSACAASGVPITTMVTYGQPDDVFDVVDQGTQRTGAHILQFAGLHVTHLNNAAAVARFLLILPGIGDRPFAEAARSFDKSTLVPFMREHHVAVVDAVRLSRMVAAAIKTKIAISGLAAAFFLIAKRGDPARLEVFAEALAHGASLEMDNPILSMRNAMVGDAAGQHYRGSDERNRAICAAVINTWNLWTAKRKARSFKPLSYKPREAFPEPRA